MSKTFDPNWVSRPSHTIEDCLEHSDLTIDYLQQFLNLSQEEFKDFIEDKLEINDSIAEKLEQLFGGSKQFWINRYDNFFTGLKEGKEII